MVEHIIYFAILIFIVFILFYKCIQKIKNEINEKTLTICWCRSIILHNCKNLIIDKNKDIVQVIKILDREIEKQQK